MPGASSAEPGQQLATDLPDLASDQGQGAAVGVVGQGLASDHDAGALDQRRVEAVEQRARARHRDRDVARGVAQGHEHRAEARPPADLRHLPLDPHRTEPVDPARDYHYFSVCSPNGFH